MSQKRVIVMRGVPGSGKSTMAKWLAKSVSDNAQYDFWVEDHIIKFGMPSLSFAAIDAAKKGLKVGESLPYSHEELVLSAIHSTDQYFINDRGEYRFTPKKLWPNHNKNYKAFRNSVDNGIQLIIVDNTNTQRKEYKKYLEYAESNGYWVSFVVMPHPDPEVAEKRNTHGVPLVKIKEMIKRFE